MVVLCLPLLQFLFFSFFPGNLNIDEICPRLQLKALVGPPAADLIQSIQSVPPYYLKGRKQATSPLIVPNSSGLNQKTSKIGRRGRLLSSGLPWNPLPPLPDMEDLGFSSKAPVDYSFAPAFKSGDSGD